MEKSEIIELYKKLDSVKATAKESGIGYQAIRRILISDGILPSERCELIRNLSESGKTAAEIAESLGISEKTARSYLPYTKKSYVVGKKTKNAERVRKSREKSREKSTQEEKQ